MVIGENIIHRELESLHVVVFDLVAIEIPDKLFWRTNDMLCLSILLHIIDAETIDLYE